VCAGGVGGGIEDWRAQSGVLRDVAHAQETADKCCETSEENAKVIVGMQSDIQHTKRQVDESREDIKRMDRNLAALLQEIRRMNGEPREP
jgi:peptidoglycan hydrolase CwlO-like protein